ncbi:MAG: HisA/HisF-related TIM barrel protein [Longimicrobiales bacterium]
MIIFAALDLQQGDVVQLVGGRAQSERVRWPDPVAVAQHWVAGGFRALHIVDLDAARGTGSNLSIVETLIQSVQVPVQVGGGIRDLVTVDQRLRAGADRVIVGTRAVTDAKWRKTAALTHPGRLVVAADVRDEQVLTHGWSQTTSQRLTDFLSDLSEDPLGAVLVTDVGREGRMTGIDANLFETVCRICKHPVYAAGGIANNADVTTLAEIGAAGAVLGMALYTGAIDVTTLPGAQA